MSIDTASFRTLLQQRLDDVLRRNAEVNDRLRHAAGLPADWEERANILAEDDALAGLDAEEREEIAATRAALDRIGEGTYGSCARCGRSIAEARLRALPLAITCVTCAAGLAAVGHRSACSVRQGPTGS